MFAKILSLPFRSQKSVGRLSFLLLLIPVISLPVVAAKPSAPAQAVIVAPVVEQQISDKTEALGTAKANESLNITANVAEKVTAIYFRDGQKVQAGSLLAVLEKSEEEANLKQAQAVLGERRLALQRIERLEKRKLAATDELDRARLAVQQAEASIAAIKARIRDREIRAPFDGVIGLRNISIGALVEAGDVIATLDDIRSIKVDFTVPAVFLPGLEHGLKIEARVVAFTNGKVYSGIVESVDSRVDPVTRSITVRAIIPNSDGKILPGLQMQVELFRNTRTALMIPEAALMPQGDKHHVMLVIKGKQASVQKREVKIGLR
jgi:membrane fusion protein (multidrug efflux system)